jgi:hypothetical protein
MWKVVAVLTIWVSPLAPPSTTPYVSCIDGHIVKTLADCPTVPRHGGPSQPPSGGGPSGGGGLLGGLLGGIL